MLVNTCLWLPSLCPCKYGVRSLETVRSVGCTRLSQRLFSMILPHNLFLTSSLSSSSSIPIPTSSTNSTVPHQRDSTKIIQTSYDQGMLCQDASPVVLHATPRGSRPEQLIRVVAAIAYLTAFESVSRTRTKTCLQRWCYFQDLSCYSSPTTMARPTSRLGETVGR